MTKLSSAGHEISDNTNSSPETVTGVISDSVIECECMMPNSSNEHLEMDHQSSLVSDNSGSDIPKMDVDNNLELKCITKAKLQVSAETISPLEIDISQVMDKSTVADDIEISCYDQGTVVDHLNKEEVQVNKNTTSFDSNPEPQVGTIPESSANEDLLATANMSDDINKIIDNNVTHSRLPDLEVQPDESGEFTDVKVESSTESNTHSKDANSIPCTFDDDDRNDKIASPYEVYARHLFQTPIPPPRHKKKLKLEINNADNSDGLEMGTTPKSKRLCRGENIDTSEFEIEYPSLDASLPMETAIMVEENPSMDTTLNIDASPVMDIENSINSAPSCESISDVESISDIESISEIESISDAESFPEDCIPDTPLSFTSTRRPLMFPSAKNIE